MLARTREVVLVWVVASTLVGCGSKESKSEKAPAAAEAPPKTKAADPGDAPAEAAPPRPTPDVATADVEGLVGAWLAAQNEGNFDAYQALYATKFSGIKRVGENKTSYDRAGWLADRGRMFKKKMVVEADGVSISTSPRSAIVRFTQTWSSGKYKDVGPKQLNLVVEGGALKISREEMLQSRPAPALDAWVKAHQKDEDETEADELPPAVAAELRQLADGVAPDGEQLGNVAWAKPLSADLVMYAIESDDIPSDEGDEDEQYEREMMDRGTTANLVLLFRQKGRFVVASAASEEGTSLDIVASADLDRDGVADAVLDWDWYHDHEGARGIALALTKSRTTELIQLADYGGEQGEGWGRDIHDLCWTQVGGRPAIVMAYMNTAVSLEEEGNPYDSDQYESEAPGFVAYVLGKSGTFAAAPVFSYWTGQAESTDALAGERNGHGVPSPKDDEQIPQLTACNAAGTFSVLGLATSAMSDDAYSVAGLFASKDAAAKAASAAKQPADRVLELGDWQTFMQRKHGANAHYEMPRKR